MAVGRIELPVVNVQQKYSFRKKPDIGNLDELEKKISAFKKNLNFDLKEFQSGTALPSAFYTDKQIWKAICIILRQNWVAVGYSKDVSKPGDYFTVNFAGGKALVIRDENGILRAFRNICNHRKKILVAPPQYPEKGNLFEVKNLDHKNILKCFYHGMKYKISDDSKLPQFVVDTWGPLVFLFMQDLRDQSGQIEKVKEHLSSMLAPLKEITADMEIETFQLADIWEDPMKCHFGFYDGNYCDANHIRDTHPSLAERLDLKNYHCEFLGPTSLQTCPVKEDSSDVRSGGMAYYFKLPPTVAVNIYKQNRDRSIPLPPDAINKDVMDTNIVIPVSEKETKVSFGFYFPPGTEQSSKDAYITSSKGIQEEDRLVCESVQIGNDSDDIEIEAVDTGIFMKPEVLEFGFQKWMIEELEKIVSELKKG